MKFKNYYIATVVLILASGLITLLAFNGKIGYVKAYTVIFIITVIISMFKPFKIESKEFKTICGSAAFIVGSIMTFLTFGVLANRYLGFMPDMKIISNYQYSFTLFMVFAVIQWILYIFVGKSKLI
ncbi:hypothetical protein G9F73_014820 [Clostridium estertheticum]|uniref:hypothetical protein n=1 Tax=Clostridium estertheticum TaxID=238834 RepID=UPI0013EE6BAC|nr:hypothetical protein [Clostridium estertheticum]MBZ9609074.1 hypothetical protein [Clostridium estertheticum]